MNAEPKPRLRCFAFSLRSMFVVMVLMGAAFAWLSQQWRIVIHRKQMLGRIARDGGNFVELELYGYVHRATCITFCSLTCEDDDREREWTEVVSVCHIPRAQAWLGDQAIFRIRLPESFGDSGKIAVRRLFPEAELEPMPLEGEIVLRPSATDAEFERIKRAFPECTVRRGYFDPPVAQADRP